MITWHADCARLYMLLAVLLLLATTASSQVIARGVKGGQPLGDAVEGRTIDAQGILGSLVEISHHLTLAAHAGDQILSTGHGAWRMIP